MAMLQRESELAEIVRLVGLEALSAEEQILMETAKSLREDFLQQNAFRDDDQFTRLKKQDLLLETILLFHERALEAQTRRRAARRRSSRRRCASASRARSTCTEDELGEFDDDRRRDRDAARRARRRGRATRR